MTEDGRPPAPGGEGPPLPTRDRVLSELYRHGTRRDEPSAACLTAEETYAAAVGSDPTTRERATDHAGRCSTCAEDLRLALQLASAARESAAELGGLSVTERKRRTPVPAAWLRLAAVLVIGAGLALVAVRSSRAPEGPAPTRGEVPSPWASTTPPDGALLDRVPSRLSWPAQPAASGYTVALFDDESTLVWESPRIASSGVELPAEVVSRLSAQGTFFWRVTVWAKGTRTTSPLLRFEVRV